MSDPSLELLTRLWAKALSTEDYDESEWKQLRHAILRLRAVPQEAKKKTKR